ncbi:MAG TPA: hypothetical protein DEB31_00415 [Clostridiales bacterium]|nr:hypothetical protein [Clostridiales bacterium]
MEYSEILVICTEQNGGAGLAGALSAAGFPHVEILSPDDSLRGAFLRAGASGCRYVVTVNENDGFSPDDVQKVADALMADDGALYVGARGSAGQKNNLPVTLFGFLAGISAADIGSSLLGMSAALCTLMADMKSTEKAFLMNVLLQARNHSIPVVEVQTGVTLLKQPGMGLLTRSFKLYVVFIKFSIAAMIAYIVDIGTFYLFEQAFHASPSEQKILYATVLSRILCSIATYLLNKGAVFKSEARGAGVVVRFIIMSAVQLLASWLLVWGIGTLFGGSDLTNTLLKVVIDLVIFLVSFPVQRDWVFKKTSRGGGAEVL